MLNIFLNLGENSCWLAHNNIVSLFPFYAVSVKTRKNISISPRSFWSCPADRKRKQQLFITKANKRALTKLIT